MNSTDPLNTLGFGIVTYRDLLWQMTWLFVALTVIMSPVLMVYKNGSGYNAGEIKSYEYLSLGNLGYSTVQCASILIDVENIAIHCPYGTVGEIFSYGVQQPVDNITSDICVITD